MSERSEGPPAVDRVHLVLTPSASTPITLLSFAPRVPATRTVEALERESEHGVRPTDA